MPENKLLSKGEMLTDDWISKLKKRMVVKGSSIREVADKAGCSYETVRNVLQGIGSYGLIGNVCEALGLSIEDIMK